MFVCLRKEGKETREIDGMGWGRKTMRMVYAEGGKCMWWLREEDDGMSFCRERGIGRTGE